MTTRSKPDVASVWPMQCAWVTSRHRENYHYWRVVGMQAVDINYYKLSKTCHHANIDAFVTWGCAQSKEAIQEHWLVDNFPSLPSGLYYRDKIASAASRDYGAVYQASTRPSASVDTFVQPASQNQDYRTARRYSYAISKKLLLYCAICYLSHYKSLCRYPYLVISFSRL